MSELTRFFESKKSQEKNTGVINFEFDAEYGYFIVGGEKIYPKDFDPFEPRSSIDKDFIYADFDELTKKPLFLGIFGKLVGGPALHVFNRQNPEKLSEVVPVMRSIYEEVLGETLEQEGDDEFVGFMGFACRVSEGGDLNLQVLGNCACIGINQHGLYTHDGIENGFVEYDLHNIDSDSQLVSIYAGMGHVSRLASGRDFDQQSFF